jgi:hypothetical protein
MNAKPVLLRGIAATMLLALGLVRAADRMDPLTSPPVNLTDSADILAQCAMPCQPPDRSGLELKS